MQIVQRKEENKSNTDSWYHYSHQKLKFLMQIFTLNSIDKLTTITEERRSIINKVVVAFILGILNFYSLVYKYQHIYKRINISVKLTDTVQTVYDYCQFIVDLYCVHKYGRNMNVAYIKQYERIDTILNSSRYEEIENRNNRLLFTFLFIWLVTSLCDFVAWYLSYGWVTPTVYTVAYIFLLIKILTTLDMLTQVIHVECRLRAMANYVQDLYNSLDNVPSLSGSKTLLSDELCNRNWIFAAGWQTVEDRPTKIPRSPQDVKWLSRCYLMLTHQCAFINYMYGLRFLLNSLSLLIDMVRYANVACRTIMHSQHTPYDPGYFAVVACVVRLLACSSVMFALVYHCEQNYRHTERMTDVITHLLINKNPSSELRTAALELRELIVATPIAYNTANFFTLKYVFLVATASAVSTYTIILLQSLT